MPNPLSPMTVTSFTNGPLGAIQTELFWLILDPLPPLCHLVTLLCTPLLGVRRHISNKYILDKQKTQNAAYF